MKLLTTDGLYIQKSDLTFLKQTGQLTLDSALIVANNPNIAMNEFIKFENEQEINFFQNLNWICDYEFAKNLSDGELFSLIEKTVEEKNMIIEKFYFMSPEERKNNLQLLEEIKILDYKIHSYGNILYCLHNGFPEIITYKLTK